MTESDAARLNRIKKLEPWVQVDDQDFDWLVEQAVKLDKAETLIKKIYHIAGASAEVDLKLWKEAEEYLGGREKARAALEESK